MNRARRPVYTASANLRGMAAFITCVDKSNPPIAIGDDHGACWTDSKLTDFESYMETVLATFGSIEARRGTFLKYNAHGKAPLRLDKAYWDGKGTLDVVMKKWVPAT